ncbi:OVARIAN TUMOR DOMAIN-containing deubiquitinating enzyme 7 [Andrographis paniculata]|uniref:OVARIAN TUMOR DOMAIN-containing deubiquitinating enzyme 7 n=1 Tax=Andrographis paniculata TaxID=175694 RepID=UPI0021E8FFA0|nr:OVARIAN TUMOR DOMAIN-containing deubiquitinating enzyme 7 [Andrographis paniculata]
MVDTRRSKRCSANVIAANSEEDGAMAKAKHQKLNSSRETKPTFIKKRGGKQNNACELRSQLDCMGLKIITVTADGNCLFRALADQIEGDEDEHEKYRKMAVKCLKENPMMFQPFVEDEVPFNKYCESMAKNGTWAGNLELQAASLVTRCNICIHSPMLPRLYIRNFNDNEVRMIHLSYHDGEHYNSVRLKEDTCSGPARPIVIKGDADVVAKSSKANSTASSREEGGRNAVPGEYIKLVKAGSGCEDTAKVEEVLHQVGGDVESAIEFLIAVQGIEDQKAAEDEHQVVNSEKDGEKVEERTYKLNVSGNSGDASSNKKNQQSDEKKISRNKACPCGSRKKYKSCCGTAKKSSSKLPVNQTVDYGKSRKDRKKGGKGGSTTSSSSSIQSDGGAPPDMGALCI